MAPQSHKLINRRKTATHEAYRPQRSRSFFWSTALHVAICHDCSAIYRMTMVAKLHRDWVPLKSNGIANVSPFCCSLESLAELQQFHPRFELPKCEWNLTFIFQEKSQSPEHTFSADSFGPLTNFHGIYTFCTLL